MSLPGKQTIEKVLSGQSGIVTEENKVGDE
jgi:hypothetical protein